LQSGELPKRGAVSPGAMGRPHPHPGRGRRAQGDSAHPERVTEFSRGGKTPEEPQTTRGAGATAALLASSPSPRRAFESGWPTAVRPLGGGAQLAPRRASGRSGQARRQVRLAPASLSFCIDCKIFSFGFPFWLATASMLPRHSPLWQVADAGRTLYFDDATPICRHWLVSHGRFFTRS